jgi:aerobic carbon-monoxide dehydrogenase medium subunit
MLTREFEYLAPATLDEAVSLLREHEDEAKLLAGGQSLVPIMKLRLAEPKWLIDLGQVTGMDYIKEDGGAFAIGAMTTHQMLETSDLLKANLPLLAETAAQIADVQVRNRGTIGGSLAHADPAADLAAAVLALGAEIGVTGPSGARKIPADDFFQGVFTTALAGDEILTEIRFPLPSLRTGAAYVKMPNPASHFAICGVAAVVTMGGDGRCEVARIGVSGVALTPFRALAAEAALAGSAADQSAISAAAEEAASGVEALSDVHASAEFRLHLTKVYANRALQLATSRAEAA